MHRAVTINRYRNLLVLATLALVNTACQQTPADTSFGVDGTSFSCVDNQCDIVFFVDNQFPDAMEIRYRAVLSNVHEGVVLELSDRITLPALQKTRVSETVEVTGRPDRLQVTVTTLQGL